MRISPHALWANAYAERFVLITRTEVTDPMLIFSERHLQSSLSGTKPPPLQPMATPPRRRRTTATAGPGLQILVPHRLAGAEGGQARPFLGL